MTSPTRDQTNHNVRLNAQSIPASLISTTINIKMGSIGGHSFKLFETGDCGENIHERSSDFTFGNLSSTTKNIWINFVLFSGENEVEFTFTPESVSGLSAHTCTVLNSTSELEFDVEEKGSNNFDFTVKARDRVPTQGAGAGSGAATPQSTVSDDILNGVDVSLFDEAEEVQTGSGNVSGSDDHFSESGSGAATPKSTISTAVAEEESGSGAERSRTPTPPPTTTISTAVVEEESGSGAERSRTPTPPPTTTNSTAVVEEAGDVDETLQERQEKTCFERVASFAFSSFGTIRAIVGV